MSAEILKFEPTIVGGGATISPDEVMDAAKEIGLTTLVLTGETADGNIYIAGTISAGDAVMLLEKAKHGIIFGDDE